MIMKKNILIHRKNYSDTWHYLWNSQQEFDYKCYHPETKKTITNIKSNTNKWLYNI